MLAIVAFTLFAILMYVLITNKLIPPVAFVILPSIAALAIGTSLTDLATYIGDGLGSILNTAVMFLFSISYFTMMADQGLFDPLVNFIMKKFGKNVTMIFIAVLLVALVSHLDGSGASTYLITIPAFKLIMDRLGVKPTAFLGTVIAMMSTMNILPWGGPTIRAASVAEVEVFDLYKIILPAVVVMLIISVVIAWFHSKRQDSNVDLAEIQLTDEAATPGFKTSKGLYIFNLVLTIILLALLFLDTPLPIHYLFMVAFLIGVFGNFRSVKEQNKKIKEYGDNAIVMSMTLFSVGVFVGIIQGTGMVDAMATSIINVLPEFLSPHMHWVIALFSVPLMIVLGTDAFYFALLPLIIGIVGPFGISPEVVAATFLITGTWGTYISPTVAANYVGIGLAETTIGEHIKANLPIMWGASIITLIAATLLGVIQF